MGKPRMVEKICLSLETLISGKKSGKFLLNNNELFVCGCGFKNLQFLAIGRLCSLRTFVKF